ncbi:MAG TPA: hypothetical protein VF142_01820 [Longimicrobium sp.]
MLSTRRPRAALALLLLAACRAPEAPQAAKADAPPGHLFDPARARVGDTVVGMRIEAMEVRRASDGELVGTVRFAGRARVSGRPGPHPDGEVDAPCFFADPASAGRLPRFPRDRRRAWFCFADPADARRMLAQADSGTVSVVIDRYTYHYAYSDVVNEARLDRVEQP